MVRKMRKLYLSIVVLMLLALIPQIIYSDYASTNPLITADLIFPDSSQWKLLTDYPHPDEKWLELEKWHLRELYLKAQSAYNYMESPDCSFITRALYENYTNKRESFFQFDIDGDQQFDIIYCGPAHCQESMMTVIWFGIGGQPSSHYAKSFPFQVLRLRPAKDPEIISYREGCCGDMVDVYNKGSLNIPAKLSIGVFRDLLLKPEVSKPINKEFFAKNELILRSSPEIKNDYNEGMSVELGHAIFGNILRKYIYGAQYRLILQYTEKEGKNWGLVLVAESESKRSYYTPLKVHIGWMEL